MCIRDRIEAIGLINEALNSPKTALDDSTLGAILGAIATDVQPASAALREQHRSECRVRDFMSVDLVTCLGQLLTLTLIAFRSMWTDLRS